MKISFITTVFNEEQSISTFLTSLFSQTKFPDEIIIVDGGSRDQTILKIKEVKRKAYKGKFKLIVKKGNRSVGRNEAIKKASGDIIVCSDAGNILDKKWIENLTSPFKNKKADVVGGYYKPITKNVFEKCLSTYTCVMSDKIDEKIFLPSSRSIAFKKSAWEKVGGYPEHLSTCEDLVFDKRLKKIKARFSFAKKAIVYWQQKSNFKEAFWQFFSYAVGDGEALYFRSQTPFLFIRYLVAFIFLMIGFFFNVTFLFILFFFFILYIFWAIKKNYKYVRDRKAFFILPVLQLVSDVAVITGMSLGLLKLNYLKLRERKDKMSA